MTPFPKAVFLAWQDPGSRTWFPIGKLSCESGDLFRFVYTGGFEIAHARAGLTPLIGFPEVQQVYESSELFPLFKNRIMSRSREEYESYVARLNLPLDGPPPLSLLARSAGRRSTDSFEIFAHPQFIRPDGEVRYCIDFFVHGIRHMPASAADRALLLEADERLRLMPDGQNPEDPSAVALRTEDKVLLGYVPRYYCPDLELLRQNQTQPEVRVLRVNASPAPVQQRVLVQLDAPWLAEAPPFDRPQYQPLNARAA
jgi:hypothetical protein